MNRNIQHADGTHFEVKDDEFGMSASVQRDDDFFATDIAWVFFFAFCLGLLAHPLISCAWESL